MRSAEPYRKLINFSSGKSAGGVYNGAVMSRSHTGYLITFEGGDGSGKTTAIQNIAIKLQDRGLPVMLLREPGGTAIGDEVRGLVHDMDYADMLPNTEALLYAASRAQLVGEVLRPALDTGKIILLDRFFDSTIAYQGFARGLGAAKTNRTLVDFATEGLVPDLTLYFDVSPEVGLRRRLSAVCLGEEWNRLDDEALDFHRRVRWAYQSLCQADDDGRWYWVDANRSREEVLQQSIGIIQERLTTAGLFEGNVPGCERRG